MPERKSASSGKNPSTSVSTQNHQPLKPPAQLSVTSMTFARKQELHRVHLESYQADEFNPGNRGNARFSPINNRQGDPVPTLYAAETLDAALMESVFHDVPHDPGFKTFDKRKLERQQHSRIQVMQDLKLADLSSKALRKLGVKRTELIDTEKDQYPQTREWAKAIHEQHPDIQGLCWVSRQDDTARALVLFGDRVPGDALQQAGHSRSLLEDEQAYREVLDLAETIGVDLVSAKGND